MGEVKPLPNGYNPDDEDSDDNLAISMMAEVESEASNLRALLSIIEMADRYYNQYTPEMQTMIGDQDEKAVDDQEKKMIAFALSRLTPKARHMLREPLQLALSSCSTRMQYIAKKIPEINREDIRLVSHIYEFINMLQPKSKHWLKTWVEGVRSGASGFLVLYNNGRTTEARHSYRLNGDGIKSLGLPEE